MAESPPAFDEKERRASQTAVDSGLASAEDAAMLGKTHDEEQVDHLILRLIQRSLATSRNYAATSH
jgi:hypothetical protein